VNIRLATQCISFQVKVRGATGRTEMVSLWSPIQFASIKALAVMWSAGVCVCVCVCVKPFIAERCNSVRVKQNNDFLKMMENTPLFFFLLQ